MKLPFKAVIFDLDNTLANTEDYYNIALRQMYLFLKPYLRIVDFKTFEVAY